MLVERKYGQLCVDVCICHLHWCQPLRMLAKVCSDLNKPNGQYILPNQREAVVHFVSTLPIRKIPGVGKVVLFHSSFPALLHPAPISPRFPHHFPHQVTEQMLRALGVSVCADLLRHRGLLRALFSKLSMDFFLSAALGLGSTSHAPAVREGEAGRKGISCERTFAPLSNKRDLEAKVCGWRWPVWVWGRPGCAPPSGPPLFSVRNWWST